MPLAPSVRATFTQLTMEAAERLEPSIAQKLRDQMPAESLLRIEQTSRLDWLPIEDDLELTRVVVGLLGPERARVFWRQNLLDALSAPLLGPIAKGAVRLFGPTPPAIVRWTPRAWPHVYSACGELAASADGSSATLSWRAIPQALRQSSSFARALGYAFSSFFDFTNTDGEVEADLRELEAGRVVYSFRWKG
ncbi:MAG TPA: hypothetical protein DFS52_30270 [Myxococcales bacterium]|nr:hypothetical protein [Myxococcales bacterium]